ncbi:SEC-C motif domain protein [Xenorhabdus bovienii str. oregonense]|uniref:SEC-C motif domain protein n=1 Tax=Xenorhabdus bovienii str. oregonense TaxID=1398202 RepID=A0A077P7L0_XENBV|nr:serine protease [Xenorhabdus bovienii]CDH05746.1 SEC-C motif domain protein [Xenorhabdus bovienii str. oregonense]
MKDFNNPIEKLVHSTVRIVCLKEDGRASSGTGYIFSPLVEGNAAYPCIVTNKHVLSGGIEVHFNLTLMHENGGPDIGNHEVIVLQDLKNHWFLHPNNDVDLAIIPISTALNEHRKNGKEYFFSILGKEFLASESLLDELSSMEEIMMIGYPNGLWDSVHNLPIIRRGITATSPKIKYNGKPEFLIDAACFPGSSGSPVFLSNVGGYLDKNGKTQFGTRIALLGTLYAGPQSVIQGEIESSDLLTDVKTKITSLIPNNLGRVIHASEILEFERIIKGLSVSTPKRNDSCLCGSGEKYKKCCGKLS